MQAFDPRTALIVVDIQNDFAHPNGSLYVDAAAEVITYANAAINQASESGALVVYTQDWHPKHTPHFETGGGIWPVHCVADTWGAQFHDDLVIDDEEIVRKGVDGADGYSGFTTRDPQSGNQTPTILESLLRSAGIERCVVLGLATDYCVKETAADAQRLGFSVVVSKRGVASVDANDGDGEQALVTLAELGVTIE